MKGDYVVTVKNDTIPVILEKWNNTRIVCMVNGIETKFNARDLLAYNIDSTEGETGRICPTIIGFKRWMFLDRTLKGKVSLFRITMKEKLIDNMSSTYSYVDVTILYARKDDMRRGKYRKIWTDRSLEKLLNDCDKFVEMKSSGWSPGFADKINFYNSICGK